MSGAPPPVSGTMSGHGRGKASAPYSTPDALSAQTHWQRERFKASDHVQGVDARDGRHASGRTLRQGISH